MPETQQMITTVRCRQRIGTKRMEMKLEPGWLMRTCHDAHIRTMLNSSPSYALAYSIQTPIPDDEAAELYAMMAARFEGWTGKSLEDQQKEQKVKKDG